MRKKILAERYVFDHALDLRSESYAYTSESGSYPRTNLIIHSIYST